MKMQKDRKIGQCCSGDQGGAKSKNNHCSYSEGIIAFIADHYGDDVLCEPCGTAAFLGQQNLSRSFPSPSNFKVALTFRQGINHKNSA